MPDRHSGRAAHDSFVTAGILCATPDERALLLAALEDREDISSDTITAHRGRLDGHVVIVAEAGVGKVNAAASATLLLDHFGCDALVLSGVAGGLSRSLEIGDLVVASRVIDIDYGRATDAGRVLYQPGSLPLPHLEPRPGYDLAPGRQRQLSGALADLDTDVTLGTIVCSDAFLASSRIRDELAATWSALAIEMEGAAVCGVAERFGAPWLIVRAMSDRAGDDSSIDFAAFLESAAASSAQLVRTLLPIVSSWAAAESQSGG